ncbi:MAG: phosphotransferase [Proteobacteria bacterium]|nr:phosphotransferase [Pseudomonadota bacterium]
MSISELKGLATKYFQSENIELNLLKGDGSDRRIYRVHPKSEQNSSVIGVWHEDIRENRNFHKITKEMERLNFPVPELFLKSKSRKSYLQQDLGHWNLAESILHWRSTGQEHKILPAYKKSLTHLQRMQHELVKPLTPHLSQSLMNRECYEKDLQYCFENFFNLFHFEKLFTKELRAELTHILVESLTKLGTRQFVFRDFQSRNIMWKENEPWFIDYQSAQLGSLYYDLASVLYASYAGLDQSDRDELIGYYYQLLELNISISEFKDNFYHMLLIRRLRSLGSYGFLAIIKNKKCFLKGIAPTLNELCQLFENQVIFNKFNVLPKVLREVKHRWSSRKLTDYEGSMH